MKPSHFDTFARRATAALVATLLVMMPFHAFLTVWGSSAIGHYTLLRLWKEGLLLVALLLVAYIIVRSSELRHDVWQSWLWRLVGLFAAVNLAWGIIAYTQGTVTLKALMYGYLVDVRPFVILLVAWVAAVGATWLYRYWRRLLIAPAAGVIAIGLLQWLVLPYDFMKHFGYNGQTIWPYETIDHKTDYIRIRSTLRGANLFGGYLIIVISVLGQRLLGSSRRRVAWALLLLAAMATMFASGSRGAWLGLVAAGGVILWLRLSSARARRLLALVTIISIIVCGGALVLLRNNDFVQNTFFHTDEHSNSAVSSNAAHIDAAAEAANQIIAEPLGRGPGTAGQASAYNTGHNARIAENNFLQIGQETGWIGLALWVAIFYLIARELWRRRGLALAQVLLASLAGLMVMAMLMHIWNDDTINYLWFGLCGIALAQPGAPRKDKHAKTA